MGLESAVEILARGTSGSTWATMGCPKAVAQVEERQEVVLEQLCGAWCRSGGNEAALLRRVFGAWAGDRGGRRTKRVGLLAGLGMRRSSR